MRQTLLFIGVYLILSAACYGQLRPAKPVKKTSRYTTSKLGLGFGRSQSVLFIMRNYKNDNEAHGWNVNAAYNLSRVTRLSAEYIWYRPIDIAPTWYAVRGSSFESNVSWIFSFPEGRARFYPLVGLSLNTFSGVFTGTFDHLNLRSLYQSYSFARTRWLGLNIGNGAEYYLKPISIFGEFRMRLGVSNSNKQLTIMDLCLSAGVRYNFRVPGPCRLFDGTRSRYVLDTREPD